MWWKKIVFFMNIYSVSRPPRTFGITSPLSLDGPTEKDEVLTEELHSKSEDRGSPDGY